MIIFLSILLTSWWPSSKPQIPNTRCKGDETDVSDISIPVCINCWWWNFV